MNWELLETSAPWIALAFSFFFGQWHAERMYKRGQRLGRMSERIDARHARQKIVLQAQRAMVDAFCADKEWDEAYEENGP